MGQEVTQGDKAGNYCSFLPAAAWPAHTSVEPQGSAEVRMRKWATPSTCQKALRGQGRDRDPLVFTVPSLKGPPIVLDTFPPMSNSCCRCRILRTKAHSGARMVLNLWQSFCWLRKC